jgi:high affinity Mn2+ porin
VQQYHGGFAALYSGPQSLANTPDTAKTFDATLYLGARIWQGGEVYVNPEIDQGFGLGMPSPPGTPYAGTFGVAGFLTGQAYKVGSNSMYERVQRLFMRQTFNFGGDVENIEPDINQLGGPVDMNRLTLTFGKFGVVDVFDNNPYAHDPANDFLNWSIIDMGSFDYAADAWGYTYGLSAELNASRSTLRGGVFQLSVIPNTIGIDPIPFRQYMPVIEFEERTSFFGGHPGSVKVIAYGDYGYMGSYADALNLAAATGGTPSTAAVRTNEHWKIGEGLNVAQEIANNVGVFARLSAMNGTYEAFEFTDIDRSISGGLSVDGALYHRPNDAIGVAGAFNSLSAPAQQYFAAGGAGILIGDGALAYGQERILETYYKVGFGTVAAITADYQRVWNPGYNTVRGPVTVFGLRYHVQI